MPNAALKTSQASERAPVDWALAPGLVPYEAALEVMEARVAAIADGQASECVWLVAHPPLYTAGTSACDEELLDPGRFPVFKTGRGGRYTYHGPGQRIAYVTALETWLIDTLAELGVAGERRPGAVGIFVDGAKIASIGVRVRRWVSLHGISLNVDPDLAHFMGIVPCGLHETPVTSLAALGAETNMARVDAALRASFETTFGRRTG